MNLPALVAAALDEDIGPGDVTSESLLPIELEGDGEVLAKQDLVVCGQAAAAEVFRQAGERARGPVAYSAVVEDGARVSKGTVIAQLSGSYRVMLTGERVALNFLMRLCGIATHVGAYVQAAGPGGPAILDTRKTTPLLRSLEKHAVRCGGARNHRTALYDGVLIKDNHLVAVGSISEAVRRARASAHHLLRVEVEVTDLGQLRQALEAGADAILLDNMGDELLAAAVTVAREMRPGAFLEASGNMTPERIARIRGLGLDAVSAGGLIHQAKWADLSLDVGARVPAE